MIFYTATLAPIALAPVGSEDAPRAFAAKAELQGQLINVIVGPLQAEALQTAIAKGAGQSISLRIQRGTATLSGSYDADLNADLTIARAKHLAAEEARKAARYNRVTTAVEDLAAKAPAQINVEIAAKQPSVDRRAA